MLQLLLFLGVGLLIASVYKMRADKSEQQEELDRVRREIARREKSARDESARPDGDADH